MQYASKLYKARGGRYKGRKRADNRLTQWTRQDWTTKSGRPSRETGERYLPRAAIESLSPAEYGATSRAKRAGGGVGSVVAQPRSIREKTRKFRKVNPIMAKSATPAQIAARKKFAERARSGELAKMRKKATKRNPDLRDLVKKELAEEARLMELSSKNKFLAPNEVPLGGLYVGRVSKDNFATVIYRDPEGDQIVPDFKPRFFASKDSAYAAFDRYIKKLAYESKLYKRNPKPTKARAVKSNPSSKNTVLGKAYFTVSKWKRGKNTVSGNPVYDFELIYEFNGNMYSGKTKPNSSFVYQYGNQIKEGDSIKATLEKTPSGRVYMTNIHEVRQANPAATRAPARSRTKLVSNGREKNPIHGYTVMCGRSGRILGYADTLPMAKAMATSIANDRNMQVKIEKN